MGSSDIENIPETGAVFTVGRSRFADNVASHFFIRKDPVVSITCGDEHSAVICQSGRLFVFGSNDWGQLGVGHKNHISKPSCVKILKPEKVTHVACGRAHTLICTGAQKIFACGSDQEGQLGRGSASIGESASSPVLIHDCGLGGSRVLQIAAGSHHSLALTSDGGVLAWGSNLEGQLGLPGTSGLVNKPTKVHIPEPVKEISAGYYHSAFLTESGLVYVCGESESGKLGIDVSFSTQVAPKQMQLPSPAQHVACGGHHTIVLAENGNLYCVGSNASGQLGMGTSVTEVQTPKLFPCAPLKDEKISKIACGESHSALVTETGKLFTCGDGRHGKLGLEENENNVHELTFAAKYEELFVSNVACGGCHTILVAQRRDANDHVNHEGDSTQIDHINKKNPLPPLKLPITRLQTESHEKQMHDKEKAEDKNTEKIEPEKSETITENIDNEVPKKLEEVDEYNKNNHMENKTDNNPDVMNNIKNSENHSDQRTMVETEDIEHHNTMENSKNTEEPEKAIETTKEESSDKNANEENGNETLEPNKASVIDAENNEENMVKTEVPENESKSEKDNSTKETMVSDVKNPGEAESTQEKKSPDKRTSSAGSTPPPKPPRLKPGSGGSSSAGKKSPSDADKENTTKSEVNKSPTEHSSTNKVSEMEESSHSSVKEATKNMIVTEINMSNDKIEIVGTEKEEGSSKEAEKLPSATVKEETSVRKSSAEKDAQNSSMNTEEKIEDEKKNVEDKTVKDTVEKEDKEKLDNDATGDDADVVQSPPPRTGKMMKLFKHKRHSEIEKNGTKLAANVNTKPKSKTCNIL